MDGRWTDEWINGWMDLRMMIDNALLDTVGDYDMV